MRIGIAADHGGFGLKEDLRVRLAAAGHEIVDFGAVGASVCANKMPGARAGLINDHFSARQGVEDDHVNIICLGGRVMGAMVAWDLVETFLQAEFSEAERHLRRLGKVAAQEKGILSAVEGAATAIPA